MLVLSRCCGEEVVLDGGIRIRVIEIMGSSRVKLGITAPDSINIRRSELSPSGPEQDQQVDEDLECIGHVQL